MGIKLLSQSVKGFKGTSGAGGWRCSPETRTTLTQLSSRHFGGHCNCCSVTVTDDRYDLLTALWMGISGDILFDSPQTVLAMNALLKR